MKNGANLHLKFSHRRWDLVSTNYLPEKRHGYNDILTYFIETKENAL